MGPINPERSVAATTALNYCLPPPHTLRPLPATPSESTGQEAKQGSPSREEYHFATAKLVPDGLPKRCLLRLETIDAMADQYAEDDATMSAAGARVLSEGDRDTKPVSPDSDLTISEHKGSELPSRVYGRGFAWSGSQPPVASPATPPWRSTPIAAGCPGPAPGPSTIPTLCSF
jgi:hypothetical protein